MKKQSSSSVDGFIPRRSGRVLGETQQPIGRQRPEVGMPLPGDDSEPMRPSRQVARNDIDDSLKKIDEEDNQQPAKKRRFFRKNRRAKKPASSKKKLIKRIIIGLIIIAVLAGAYVGIKALLASGNVFKGNPFDIFQNQPLKKDENGRSNILVFGTSEDDGPDHGGANLTDSIMVVSIDQDKKNAYMVSIPRDLYVEYGETCPEGYRGKINSLYDCFSDGEANQEAGANALRKKVGEVLGLDVQYYAHLNYTVVRDAVNAVGGIDLTIESEDPRGILDRNFDWKCGYKCYYVKYANGEKAHLDGEHALALARARNASGGYGLPGGNFDREKNQQKIIKALREKAVSAGTLTNVGKVTALIDALGNNLRTNFETKEIRTLMSLGTDIPSENIQPISLVQEGEAVVTTDNIAGASVVVPIAGLFDYSDIQTYVLKKLNSNAITREAAQIVMLNGSAVIGVGQKEADSLTAKGFSIASIDNAPAGTYARVEIYQIGKGMTATAAKLKELYNVKTIKTSTPPIAVAGTTNFVIIIGQDLSSSSN
ncbi:MAG: cell envelope-related function transcriptional attenuator, LytR/CpsA family protein nonfunctional [Candidatus Saccharibacteria bacterium]|nr:cell envelope-related function transcriptional attenuator, LytR/CpsA family protein nonfunctional [Candidatus Saccharibacteria bacterium]